MTINFDDPGTCHFYYADAAGSPGTILTFFSWPGMAPGRPGIGLVVATAWRVPQGSLDFWEARFRHFGVEVQQRIVRLGENVLRFRDPDGMDFELVETTVAPAAEAPTLEGSAIDHPIPAAMALQGFHSATISVDGYTSSAKVLTDIFGFVFVSSERGRYRFEAAGTSGEPGRIIDLLCQPDRQRGVMGAGSVHHLALRAATEPAQLNVRQALPATHVNVTPVLDRSYFRLIYFLEPGGVILEVATDPPGFGTDEPAHRLGTSLRLPPWLEGQRAAIAASLPPIGLPSGLRLP